jgi:hypothetical protein
MTAEKLRLLSRPSRHALSDVFLVGALLSLALGKSRAGRETQRQNKDQTEWFHDGVRALGNLFGEFVARPFEMFRLHQLVHDLVNLELADRAAAKQAAQGNGCVVTE